MPTSAPKPPKLGQVLLSLFLDQADQEAVLGDLAEEYGRLAATFGSGKAGRWYWLELLKTIPVLFFFIRRKFIRRQMMRPLSFLQDNHKVALVGGLLLLPAGLLVSGGILQSAFGLTPVFDTLNIFEPVLFHPLMIGGGLLLALALNLVPVVRLKFEDGNLVGMLKIRGKLLNLGLVIFCTLLVTVIFVYLLFENGPCIFGGQVSC